MANESRREGQPDWQFLYENAACGYLTLTRELQITRINATALAWLEHDRQSLVLPQPLSKLMDPADITVLSDNLGQLAGAESRSEASLVPASFHGQLRRRNGFRFPALFHLSTDSTNPDICHLAVFHLHQFEDLVEALARSNVKLKDEEQQQTWRVRRLASIAEAMTDSIISVDHRQIITFANPAAWKLFRTDLDGMLGTRLDRDISNKN